VNPNGVHHDDPYYFDVSRNRFDGQVFSVTVKIFLRLLSLNPPGFVKRIFVRLNFISCSGVMFNPFGVLEFVLSFFRRLLRRLLSLNPSRIRLSFVC